MQWNSLVENATEASVHVDLRGEMSTWRKVHWSMNRVTHFSLGRPDPHNCQR